MNDAPDLFDFEPSSNYPETPGHRGVDTSIAAADAMAPHLGRLQQLTLETIADSARHGCTANELADRTRLPREAVQPRTSELRRMGKIVDSGQRRPNPNGKSAIVWTLPEFKRSEAA